MKAKAADIFIKQQKLDLKNKFQWYKFIFNQFNQLFYIKQINQMHLNTNDKCLEAYNQMKLQKTGRNIVYKIDTEQIVVERVGDRDEGWKQFLEALPQKQFRYCVFDFEFTTADNRKISKLAFINWSPDGASLKTKVLYATAKEGFKSHLGLNTKDFTLTSTNDMTLEDMIQELSK